MSTVKSKNLQVGTDATASNNFTIYQPSTPDGTLRIGVGNADSPTEVGRFNNSGYVATNLPAFGAYRSSNQAISANTWTKMQCNTEEFDATNNYDNATNYRFQPTIEGYYQFNMAWQSLNAVTCAAQFFKNGSAHKVGNFCPTTTIGGPALSASALIYLNGSTDYVEAYAYGNGATSIEGGVNLSWFNGFLARAV